MFTGSYPQTLHNCDTWLLADIFKYVEFPVYFERNLFPTEQTSKYWSTEVVIIAVWCLC